MKLKNLAVGALGGLIGIISLAYVHAKEPELKNSTSTIANSSKSMSAQAFDDLNAMWKEHYEKDRQQRIAVFKYEKEELNKLDKLEIPLGYRDNLNNTPYWYWKEYSGSKGKKESKMDINVLNDPSDNCGIRIDYYMPKKAYAGIFHEYYLKASLDKDMWEKNGIDVSGFDGIELQARGNGKFRLQLTEGYSHDFHTDFGEIYPTIITPKSKWKTYRIPFKKLVKRPDFQHTQEEFDQQGLGRCCLIEKEKFDNNLDLREIHSTEIEPLRKGVLFEKNRYIEIKNMYFYKKDNKEK